MTTTPTTVLDARQRGWVVRIAWQAARLRGREQYEGGEHEWSEVIVFIILKSWNHIDKSIVGVG